MLDVRMHPAVAQQADQVQLPLARRAPSLRAEAVAEELSVADQLVDARDIHVHDASGAHIQCPTSLLPICPSGNPTNGPEV